MIDEGKAFLLIFRTTLVHKHKKNDKIRKPPCITSNETMNLGNNA